MNLSPFDTDQYTVEEYLEQERSGVETRSEYVDGYIIAMAGGTVRHNRIISRLSTALNVCLSDKPCEVFISDMKLKVESAFVKSYRYPDIIVTCEKLEEEADICESPILIVEVLSPSTKISDKVYKSAEYGHILKQTNGVYLIIDPLLETAELTFSPP